MLEDKNFVFSPQTNLTDCNATPFTLLDTCAPSTNFTNFTNYVLTETSPVRACQENSGGACSCGCQSFSSSTHNLGSGRSRMSNHGRGGGRAKSRNAGGIARLSSFQRHGINLSSVSGKTSRGGNRQEHRKEAVAYWRDECGYREPGKEI